MIETGHTDTLDRPSRTYRTYKDSVVGDTNDDALCLPWATQDRQRGETLMAKPTLPSGGRDGLPQAIREEAGAAVIGPRNVPPGTREP